MARAIERIAGGLLRISEDGMIEVLGGDSGTLDGSFRSDGSEFLGRIVFDFSAVTSKGRTRPADDGNVSRF